MSIPKLIHLTHWGNRIPSKYRFFYNKILALHPSWKVHVYDDAACRSVIEEHLPRILPVYDHYQYNIQRSDLFRYLVAYAFGGFYLDMDIELLKPLDELCNVELVLCEEWNNGEMSAISNYGFGGTEENSFWLSVIDECLARNNPIDNESDILRTTGPGMLTDVYHALKPESLIISSDRICRICNKKACQFGDYGIHHHYGSWRWQTPRRI